MRISFPLNFALSFLALTLTTTLVACGGDVAPPAGETPTAETEEPAAEEPAEETAAPEEEKPENVQKIQDAIKTNLPQELPGAVLDSVSCPADAELKAESTFDCDVSTPDGDFPLTVTMTDDTGNLTFKSKGIVSLVKLEETLVSTLKEQAQADVTADCGSADQKIYFFDEVGETFECEVTNTADGTSQPVKITISSEDGEVRIES